MADTVETPTIDTGGLGQSDLDIINSEDETPEETAEEVPEEETEEPEETSDESDKVPEDGETEEGTEEEADETEADEEDIDDAPEGSLFAAIKKEDPKVFEKFPQLKDVILREEQFTEVFTNPEEAGFAKERSEVFGKLEQDIVSGNVENLLAGVKGYSDESLATLAHNFLPTLGKLDKDLYTDILVRPVQNALRLAFADGRTANNQNLWASAVYIHEFLFGNKNIDQDVPVKGAKKTEENPETLRLKKEIEERDARQYYNFRDNVIEIRDHKMTSEVKRALTGVEVDGYKLKNIVRDIQLEIGRALEADKRHLASMQSLWMQAKSAGFPPEWKSKIANAYVGRAKSVLPAIKKKVLAEAGVTVKGATTKPVKKALSTTGSTSPKNVPLNPRKIDWGKTSDADILSEDTSRIKFKR